MESMLNRRLFVAALAWVTLTAANNAAPAEPVPSSKVVFVIVDGIPADVVERVPTPAIDAIAAVGGYGRATVGGPIGEPGETPTISAPGYMSLITGTWANKHNVYKNYGISPDYRYWNLFRLVRSEKPELQLAIFSTWTDNRKILLGEGLAEGGNWRFDMAVDGLEKDEVRFPPQPLDAHIADIEDRVAPKRLGPMLYKMLRGKVEDQFEDIPISELKVPGGEQIILDLFEKMYPEDTPVDKKILAFDKLLEGP